MLAEKAAALIMAHRPPPAADAFEPPGFFR
jgi:hypothetical protein